MCEAIVSYVTPYAIGLVALMLGQLVVAKTLNLLRRKISLDAKGLGASAILGMTEGVLYLGAFLLKKPEFIAVWLGLKTVIRWRHWESDIPIEKDGRKMVVFGREAYNVFLIGNALVIAYATLAWKLVDHASKQAWPQVFAIALAGAGGSVALILLAYFSKETKPTAANKVRPAN